MKTLICAILLLTAVTSCYRMPTEDDYCVTPLTNNPEITRESPQQQLMPQVGY